MQVDRHGCVRVCGEEGEGDEWLHEGDQGDYEGDYDEEGDEPEY